jgi:glycosyltransferase involved in cell wall biosynthesis
MPDRPPRVLAILPALFPSTVIGVAKPLLRLHQDQRITLDLTLQYLATRRAVERADVVVMCHTIDPQYGEILQWARELGRSLLYEIDDDLLKIPEHIPGLAYLREPARREQLIACIRQADVVRVYSPALQQKLSAYNPNVTLVSGPLDWTLMPPPARKSANGPVKIVYATSRSEDTVGEMLIAPLLRVLDRFPNVQLTIWGPRHPQLAKHPRTRTLAVIRDYDTFFARFAAEGFDIGLAPLPDDEFHRGKSNNKFREYASCGIAGVYSDISVYNTSVMHEQTGLLVANDDAAWASAIERLIVDATLRRGIGDRSRAYARAHFNEAITDGEWMKSITQLAERARPLAPTTPAALEGAKKAWRLAQFVGRLGSKVSPVFREHGVGTVMRRTWVHVLNLGQMMSWEIRRRRLEQRVSAQRVGHE